jgi:uncharacterized protein (TIGR03435 family)
MYHTTRLLIVCLLATLSPAQTVSYDVATIKYRKGPINFSADPVIRGRAVTGIALTVRDLLTYAYAVRYDQLSGGPSWAADDHYDILAKSEGEGTLTLAQSRQMMQALLAERFHLQIHRETQEVPVYALVVGNNGPKLTPATETTGCYSVRGDDKGLRMEARCGTMDQVARQLAGTAGRFVVDKTGLTGRYAFTLVWWPANRIPPPDSDAPSMFKAVEEQLGLKLESGRGPIEMLLIDHVEKPTDN